MASKESKKKVKALEEKRHHDSDAQREWDKLVDDYDNKNSTHTPHNPKTPKELKALIEELAGFLDERKSTDRDCGDDSPCGDTIVTIDSAIDLESLAEIVFERLIYEARIERDRAGWAAWARE